MAITRRAFLAGAAGAVTTRAAQQPNVVFLLTDDQRWDSLGCMGNRIVRTPNIDKLAAGGVTFENHFVTTAICMTSRASILTGQYARRHGIWDFAKPLSDDQFSRSYPALFRAAGYYTGLIGKYGVGNQMPSQRFDSWAGFPGQGKYFPQGEDGPHLTEVMGQQAVEFLRGVPKNKPFCLSVSFKAPHVQDEDPRQFLHSRATADLYSDAAIPVPKTADPRFIASLPREAQRSEGRRRWAVRFSTPELYRESVRSYYRLITEVDTVVGRVRDELSRLGVDGNTVIVYSSDNGFYLGEHGLAGKWLMHEESIRVPMILHDPRLPASARGTRRKEMSLNIDIAPTLLDAAGVESPGVMQGRSVYPLIRGGAREWREEWFYEHLFENSGWIPPVEGVRTQRWKYARYVKTSPVFEELYDLAADPLEERNLAAVGKHADQLKFMRGRWEHWRRAAE